MPTLYAMPETCSLSPNIAVAWLAHRARMEVDEGVKRALARQSMEPIG